MPVIDNIGHWLLVFIDFQTKVIYLFNSLGGYDDASIIGNVNLFIKYFSDTLGSNSLFSNDIILINWQYNGIDCGVFTLYNLELIFVM